MKCCTKRRAESIRLHGRRHRITARELLTLSHLHVFVVSLVAVVLKCHSHCNMALTLSTTTAEIPYTWDVGTDHVHNSRHAARLCLAHEFSLQMEDRAKLSRQTEHIVSKTNRVHAPTSLRTSSTALNTCVAAWQCFQSPSMHQSISQEYVYIIAVHARFIACLPQLHSSPLSTMTTVCSATASFIR